MRYDGPAKFLTRMCIAEVELEGARIKAGDLVVLLVGAANRDPEQFEDPDQLDIRRADPRHLGFGYGIHFCEGAALARLEAEIAMNSLLQRLPDMKLAVPVDELNWTVGSHLRSLRSLPLTI